MQYETIILELMSRIKVLENEVADMKERIDRLTVADISTNDFDTSNPSADSQESTTYTKMTDAMMDICYAYGKKAYQIPDANMGDYADIIAEEVNMNRNSAFMYVYVVKCMLEGTVYKRAISTKALKKYFSAILAEFGAPGLLNALKATRKHIDYRQALGHTVDSIIEACDEYQRKL